MKRTDIHRPSAIIPSEYEFITFDYIKTERIGDCFAIIENRRLITEHMGRTGGNYSVHEHGGNCHICGAHAVYTALFYHPPTNSYIRTGQDCADKLAMGYGDMDTFRTSIKNAIDLQKGKRHAEAVLAEAGLARAWHIHIAYQAELSTKQTAEEFDIWNRANRDESKISDIVLKLIKYGSVSDAQMNFIRTLVDRVARKPEIEAQRAAEREIAADCPIGRVTVTGTIVALREQESDFGVTLKMTVKATEGYIVWCTVPSGMDADRGKEVSFVATLTPSPTDPKFGFGKRPKFISTATAAEGRA